MSIRGGGGRCALALLLAISAVGAGGAHTAFAAPSGWLNLDGSERYSGVGGTYDWANSGTAPPAAVCPAGAVNVTGAGGLFNCGSPGGGSAPPNAPALTPA